MNKKHLLTIGIMLLIFAAGTTGLRAATLSGKVFDEFSGRPLSGVTIRLSDAAYVSETDEQGLYRIDNIKPGNYRITITLVGYAHLERRVVLKENDQVELNFFMIYEPVNMGDITVTASRYQQEVFDAPQNVSVTSEEEIARTAGVTTADYLSEETGILVQKTTYGHGAPIIRGLIGRYVVLLYDGIRLNKPTFRLGGNQYLNTVDPLALSRIEVVRGPSSVMYGSDAIGGVVNLIPRTYYPYTDKFDLKTGLFGKYTSADNGWQSSLNLQGTYRKLAFDIVTTYKKLHDLRAGGDIGKQTPTGWDEIDLTSRVVYRFTEYSNLIFDYIRVRQENVPRYDQYASGKYAVYLYDPQDRDLVGLTCNLMTSQSLLHHLKFNVTYQFENEGRVQQKPGATLVAFDHDKLTSWGGSFQINSLQMSGHRLTYGGEYYYDEIDSKRFEYEGNTVAEDRPAYPDGSSYHTGGLFLQDEWYLAYNWQITAGMRFSYNKIESDLGEPFDYYEDEFKDLTGALSLTFQPLPQINLIGSWSRGFRAPNFNDAIVLKPSSSGIDAPSPGITAENSNNFELGCKLNYDLFEGSFFVYYNRLNDLIDRRPGLYDGLTYLDENNNGVQDPDEYDIYQKFNVGKGEIYGFEYEGYLHINSSWEIRSNLFWTRGENITDHEPLSRIPPLMGLIGLRRYCPTGDGWAEVYGRFAGDQRRLSQRDIDDSRIEDGGTAGWGTLNLRTYYNFHPVFVSLTFENITDQAYKLHGSGIYSAGRNLVLTVGYRP